MVRKDHESVGSWRVPDHALDGAKDVIDAVECLQGLGTFGAGVVCDLVVIDEVGVDHRHAAKDALDDQGRRQLAKRDVRHGA